MFRMISSFVVALTLVSAIGCGKKEDKGYTDLDKLRGVWLQTYQMVTTPASGGSGSSVGELGSYLLELPAAGDYKIYRVKDVATAETGSHGASGGTGKGYLYLSPKNGTPGQVKAQLIESLTDTEMKLVVQDDNNAKVVHTFKKITDAERDDLLARAAAL